MKDFNDFESRIILTIGGWVDESLDTDEFNRCKEASLTTESTFQKTEYLEANLVNLDSWFTSDWRKRRFGHTIDLGDDRDFIVDPDDMRVSLDLRKDELIQAAEHRAAEDETEPAYVLGKWTYLANKADHVNNSMTLRSAFERVKTRRDQPDDATFEEFHGGAKA